MVSPRFSVSLLALVMLGSGCVSSRIANLTPSQQRRNADGLYAVEAAWVSNQQSQRKDSLTPVVMVDGQKIPMQRTKVTVNRWEALVPVPAGSNYIHYQFRFDYQYNELNGPKADSVLSPSYVLRIQN